jgi:uncharacterized membrane protein
MRDADARDDDQPDVGDLYDELEELAETVNSPEEREQVQETMRLARRVQPPVVFGRVISGFDRGDAMEAVLGALLFGIPMTVEGGTNEVGAFLATHPLALVATHVFAVGLVIGILFVADIQDVRVVGPLFGFLPQRLVGVLAIAFGTAVVLLTAWGRVTWSEPWLAFATVSVAFVPMAIGAALGDILPGS